jgi:hypothetical protein
MQRTAPLRRLREPNADGTRYAQEPLGSFRNDVSPERPNSLEGENKMKKLVLISELVALALVVGALLPIGAQAEDKPQTSVTGTITKVSSDDFVLQTDQGELRFDTSHKTVKPATALAVGQKITVWYDADSDTKHELDATRVETFTEPAPTTQAPPPTPTQTYTPPPAPTQTQTTENTSTQESLPRTASPLPLMGLTGLLSLAGSALLLKQGK